MGRRSTAGPCFPASALGVAALVLTLGCATPHSSGGLWALDEAHLEEALVYRTPDPRRAAQAREYQLVTADQTLAADQSRLEQLLATCPEPRQDRLEPSLAAQARDGVRARHDPDRQERVARLAAADWYARRAATTGQASLCDRARVALTQPAVARASVALPDGLVQREITDAAPLDASADPYQALAAYALGLVDAVRGPAPLVGHIAAIYGGSLQLSAGQAGAAPEEIVDRVAPGLTWEPDGLYAALRAAR